jgi:hypothetical protein
VNTSTKQTNAAPATSGALKPETYTASQHTPEPWNHSADLPHHGCRLIHAADGYLVADAGRITRRTGDEMDSNARRIVACVNACAGMKDPQAEIAALRAALEPFAELATSAKCDEMPEFAACTFIITAASMLAARAAIAGKGDK